MTINKVALGQRNEECGLFSDDYNHQNGQVLCGKGSRYRTQYREKITIATLDSFIDAFSENDYIGVMKIDIEGFEYFMFQGAKEFLKKH